MFYKKVELKEAAVQRWYGGQAKVDTEPYTLELFSGSDWASCQVSRRGTSSVLIFFEWMFDPQPVSVADINFLNSMEAEILAATKSSDRRHLCEAGIAPPGE